MLSACGGPQNPCLYGPSQACQEAGGQQKGGGGQCSLQLETMSKTKVDVDAAFGYSLAEFEGHVNYDAMNHVKVDYDRIQKDFDLASYKLCQDFDAGRVSQQYYERHRTCHERAMRAMRAMELELKGAAKDTSDPKEVAWALEAKNAWMQRQLECDESAVPVAETSTKKVDLTAYLVCQRKSGNKYEDIPDCADTKTANLKGGDRVKIGLSTDQTAKIYIVNYSDDGTFQVLFPDPGVDNEIAANTEMYLPDDEWLYLSDDHTTEHLQIVAAAEKIPLLEKYRGKEFQTKGKGKLPKEGMKTRGLLEPITSRKWIKKGPVKLKVKSEGKVEEVQTIPAKVSSSGAAVVEFVVTH